MMRRRSYRFLATCAVFVLVFLFMDKQSTPDRPPAELEITTPTPGLLLKSGDFISVEGRFKNAPKQGVRCQEQSVSLDDDGRFSLRVSTPSNGGMLLIKCTVPGGRSGQHFSRAYYVDPQPKGKKCKADTECETDESCRVGRCKALNPVFKRVDDMDVVQDAGALVLPETFFNAGYSNFLPMLDEALDTQVAPSIEQSLAEGEIPGFETGLSLLKLGVTLERFGICDESGCENPFDLSVAPLPPNRLQIKLRFNSLQAKGSAFVSLGFGANYDVELDGTGGLSAEVALSIDSNGKVKAAIDPETIEIGIELLCFKKLYDSCIKMEKDGRLNTWMSEKLSPHLLDASTELDKVFAEQLVGLKGEAEALNQSLNHEIRLKSLKVSEDRAVIITWDVAFESPKSKRSAKTLSWAGDLPRPHSTRPHLLISDRLSNYVLHRLWAGGLSKSLPSDWIRTVRDGVAMSGYQLEEMKLGMPPVLQPVDNAGLRLLIPEVAVTLKEEDDTLRSLHLHGTLPIQMRPNQSNSGLVFLADHPASAGRDDPRSVSVECLDMKTDAGEESCSADSFQFQRMTEIGLQVAGGLRAAFELPLTGPSLPAPHGQLRQLGFTRIQLLEDSPGWLMLETDY